MIMGKIPDDISTPEWVLEFLKWEKKAKKKNNKQWYHDTQPKLKTLMETGLGNCVAWSRLMAHIVRKKRLRCFIVVIVSKYPDNKNELPRHQFNIIFDDDNNVWCQSSIYIRYIKQISSDKKLTKKQIMDELKERAESMGKKSCKWKDCSIDDIWKVVKSRNIPIIRDGKPITP